MEEKKVDTLTLWYYRDIKGVEQGPFHSTQMAEWFQMGYFNNKMILVRRACDLHYYPLENLIKLNIFPFTTVTTIGASVVNPMSSNANLPVSYYKGVPVTHIPMIPVRNWLPSVVQPQTIRPSINVSKSVPTYSKTVSEDSKKDVEKKNTDIPEELSDLIKTNTTESKKNVELIIENEIDQIDKNTRKGTWKNTLMELRRMKINTNENVLKIEPVSSVEKVNNDFIENNNSILHEQTTTIDNELKNVEETNEDNNQDQEDHLKNELINETVKNKNYDTNQEFRLNNELVNVEEKIKDNDLSQNANDSNQNVQSSNELVNVEGKDKEYNLDQEIQLRDKWVHSRITAVLTCSKYAVVLEKDYNKLKLIEVLIKKAHLKNLKTLEKNKLCIAEFEEEKYRGLVTNLTPLTVYFIDYGNESECKSDTLYNMPDELAEIPPLALSVFIINDDKKSDENDPVNIHFIKKCNDYWIGEIEVFKVNKDEKCIIDNKKSENCINDVEKSMNSLFEATKGIFHVIKKCTNSCFIGMCLLNNSKSQNEIFTLTNLSPSESDLYYRPQKNELVAAFCFDEIWCRALVVYEATKININYTVELIDFGIIERTPIVVPLPDSLKNIARLSMRCKIVQFPENTTSLMRDKFYEFVVQENTESESEKIQAFMWDRDEVIKSEENQFKVELFDYRPSIDETGPSYASVENGDIVKIAHLNVFRNECYLICLKEKDIRERKEFFGAIECSYLEAEKMNREFQLNEIVVVLFNESYLRGQIIKKSDNYYTVHLLDFGSEIEVLNENIRNLPTSLKNFPCQAVPTSLEGVPRSDVTKKVDKFLNEIFKNDENFIVIVRDFGEVELLFVNEKNHDNEISFNKYLVKLLSPRWKKYLRRVV